MGLIRLIPFPHFIQFPNSLYGALQTIFGFSLISIKPHKNAITDKYVENISKFVNIWKTGYITYEHAEVYWNFIIWGRLVYIILFTSRFISDLLILYKLCLASVISWPEFYFKTRLYRFSSKIKIMIIFKKITLDVKKTVNFPKNNKDNFLKCIFTFCSKIWYLTGKW